MRLDKEAVRNASRLEDVLPWLTGHPVSHKPGLRDLITRCVWHDDERPSLRVNTVKGTVYCDVCSKGSDVFGVVADVRGVDFHEALKILAERAGLASGNGVTAKAMRKIEAIYPYRDASGVNLFDVVRHSPKGFAQRRPDGKGGYIWNLDGVRRVLYRLPELHGHEAAIYVEGEKCADRLVAELASASLAVAVTTSPQGAGKWSHGDYAAQMIAAGVKRLTVLPDNDAPGQRHAREIARSCMAAGLQVRIVELPGLPAKGDVVDFLDGGHDVRELVSLAKDTPFLTEPPADDQPADVVPYVPRVESVPDDVGDDSDEAPADEDPWPEPLGAHARVGLLGEVVDAIEPQTESDPAAIALVLLTMFGVYVGRHPYVRVGATQHFLNLNVGLVGETGIGRKGAGQDYAEAVFRHSMPDSPFPMASGLSSGEGLIWAIRDKIEKQTPVREKGDGRAGKIISYETEIVDPGVTDKRLLVVETEFASTLAVMKREGNPLSATIRQAWDGKDLRVLTKNSPVMATAPHVGLVVHVTPAELRSELDKTSTVNGFANRFLWVAVRRSKLLPDGGSMVSMDPFAAPLRRAVEFASRVGEMRRDPSATALWHDVYPVLSTPPPGLLGSLTARGPAMVIRLSAIYALLELSTVVRRSHLLAALEVWRYCFESTRNIFGSRLGDETADTLWSALRAAPDGLTPTEVHRHFGNNVQAGRIRRAFALLREARLAYSVDKPETGGRPAEIWHASSSTLGDYIRTSANVVSIEAGEGEWGGVGA